MPALFWPIVLLVVGLMLVALEFFVPSAGILGVLATVALLASVGLAFGYGPWAGLSFMAAIVVALPVLVVFAVKVWPHTPMGRRLLLDTPGGDAMLPDTDQRRWLKSLVGKLGVAKSLMMPSGDIDIAGQTVDAVSEGMSIEPGQAVRVIEVRGSRVVVRPAGDTRPVAAGDPLSQPIENFGLDPFDDPLA